MIKAIIQIGLNHIILKRVRKRIMALKKYVTARSVTDNLHIFIETKTPKDAFNTAGKLHQLGEHHYTQIRLRSSKPSLQTYRWISLILRNGA